MKKMLSAALFILSCILSSSAQTYITRNGYIGFFSTTPLEHVKAINNQVYAIIDGTKKEIAFTLLVKSFRFEKELMQEDFNSDYIESDQFPKANFTGSYSGDVQFNKDGVYPVEVTGNLTLHGVTKMIKEPATMEVKNGRLLGKTQFTLKPEDFNIKIPSLVRAKIAQLVTVDVQIDCSLVK